MNTRSLLLGLTAAWFFSDGLAIARESSLSLDLGSNVRLETVLVQEGAFQQGSPLTEEGREAHESQRAVTLTKPYLMGKFPVTVGQFERFVQETRYRTEAEVGTSGGYGWDGSKLVQGRQYTWRNPGFPQTSAHPVTLVTWFDAQQFCQWLSRKARIKVDLPTEAQWEYACRAGSTGPWHGASADDIAWHRGNAGGGTHPVGTLTANAWGLHDMSGNVWEWCQDWYGPYPGGPQVDPVQSQIPSGEKGRRVLRGGSFLKGAGDCRSAERYRNDPRSRNADNGLRVMSWDVDGPPKTMATPVESPTPLRQGADATRKTGTVPAPQPPAATPSHAAPEAVENQASRRTVSYSSTRRSYGMWILAIPLLIFGSVVALLIFGFRKLVGRPTGGPPGLPRSLGGSGPAGAARNGPVTEATSTGFWLKWDVPEGTLVHWSCTCGGERISGQTSYQPGPRGLFILTGQTPSSISVSSVGPVLGSTLESYDNSLNDDNDRRERERRDEAARQRASSPSRRDPSAY